MYLCAGLKYDGKEGKIKAVGLKKFQTDRFGRCIFFALQFEYRFAVFKLNFKYVRVAIRIV